MDRRDELPYLLSSPRFWSNGFLIGGGRRRHLTYKVGAGAEMIPQKKESCSICLLLIMDGKSCGSS